MKKFYSLHIHSTFASFSSNDVILYKEFEDESLQEIDVYGDNKVQVFEIKPVDKFYKLSLQNKMKQYHNSPEFKELVESYTSKGWTLETPTEVSEYFKRCEINRIEQRKKEGFVIVDSQKMTPEKYQGGFSSELFSNKWLQNYVSRKAVFGYIGHSVRKPSLDKVLEKACVDYPKISTKYTNRDILAMWMTSSDARHFSDSIEENSQANEKIKEYVSTLMKTGLKYLKEQSSFCQRSQ